jgi:hypothetical protein
VLKTVKSLRFKKDIRILQAKGTAQRCLLNWNTRIGLWNLAKRSYSYFFHALYIICNKCVCSISIGSWMSYGQWPNSYNRSSFCLLRYHFNSCIVVLLRPVW